MPEPKLLTRGKVENQALGAAGIYNFDVDVNGASELTVMADMTGAADADLDVTVQPYEADNTTLLGVNMPVASSTGPTQAGGEVSVIRKFDVSGVQRVRVRIQNDNAGAQTLKRASWALD